MTTLYQAELTQISAANRTDWLYIRSAAILLTSMVCCAFVFRIAVVASSFLNIAAPSLDHGQFGAEMGCHFGNQRSLRGQGLDRVSRFTGGRGLPTVPTRTSNGLYIYRRNTLPDEEFGGVPKMYWGRKKAPKISFAG